MLVAYALTAVVSGSSVADQSQRIVLNNLSIPWHMPFPAHTSSVLPSGNRVAENGQRVLFKKSQRTSILGDSADPHPPCLFWDTWVYSVDSLVSITYALLGSIARTACAAMLVHVAMWVASAAGCACTLICLMRFTQSMVQPWLSQSDEAWEPRRIILFYSSFLLISLSQGRSFEEFYSGSSVIYCLLAPVALALNPLLLGCGGGAHIP